jgi:hypothetical protein
MSQNALSVLNLGESNLTKIYKFIFGRAILMVCVE